MKKITGMMLGLGLIVGTAALTFAADDKAPAPKTAAVKCKDSKTGKAVKAVKGKCPEGSTMVTKAAPKAAPAATK